MIRCCNLTVSRNASSFRISTFKIYAQLRLPASVCSNYYNGVTTANGSTSGPFYRKLACHRFTSPSPTWPNFMAPPIGCVTLKYSIISYPIKKYGDIAFRKWTESELSLTPSPTSPPRGV